MENNEKQNLIDNLVFLYHVIKASHDLIETAARKEQNEELKAYFQLHCEEEKDHEKWLERDLKSEGIDVTITPLPKIAVVMVGSVYYLINNVDPAALLGYMLLMEGNSLPLEKVEQLENKYGKTLLKTVRFHSEKDVGHSKDIRDMINKLPQERVNIVISCLTHSKEYFMQALNEIYNRNKVENGSK